ncbi:MAG: PAS domain S-box protein [Candidatus Hermodarchaeota archaeon]
MNKIIKTELLDFPDIFNSIDDLIFFLDYDGKILRFNKRVLNTLSYSEEQLLTMEIFDIYPPNLRNDAKRSINSIIDGKTTSCTIPIMTKEEKSIPVDMRINKAKLGEKDILISISRDITEFKRAEQKLSESEEQFRNIAEQSLIGITIIQNGVIKYFNDRFLEMNGYTAEEIRSWSPYEYESVLHPEDKEFVMEQAHKKQEGDPDVVNHYTYRVITKDGEVRWREIFSKTINYEGHPADLAMTYDITDKIKAEQELKDSEEKFRTITEQSLVGISIIQDGLMKYMNEKHAEMGGYSIEELKSRTPNELAEIIHPEDREFVLEQLRKKQEGDPNVVNQYSYRIIRKDGEIRWREIFSKTINYEGALADLVITYDITDKIKFEQQLKESEEKFSKAFNSNALSMCISSLEEGKLIEANEVFLKFLGISRKDIIGKNYNELKLWQSERIRNRAVKIINENRNLFNVESSFRSTSGEIKYGLFSFVRIILKNKPYLLTIVNDITPRKLAEKRLKKSKEKYRKAYNQAEFYRDLFVHDINNTLQTLFTSIELIDVNLKGSKTYGDIKEFLELLYRQINRGKNLISNVRKLSELENFEISIKEVDLFEVLNRSIEFIKNSFQNKKIEINTESSVKKNLILGNDLLQDVFENILLNSVNHNRQKKVEILIKISELEQDDIIYSKLEFIDNGIGIEDLRKEKVLQRANFDFKTTYGMGLGLSLVNKIIENLHGKIRIEDRVKGDYTKGTKIILLIPKRGYQ